MTASVDMTAVLAKLDKLYDGRGEADPLTDYATYDRAIRAVLEVCRQAEANTFGDELVSADDIEAAIAAALGVTE